MGLDLVYHKAQSLRVDGLAACCYDSGSQDALIPLRMSNGSEIAHLHSSCWHQALIESAADSETPRCHTSI